MMNIVILDGYTANPGDLSWDRLKTFGELTVYERTHASETVELAKDADIVLTNKVILGKAEIEQLPRLKYIGVLATGYNVVDTKVAREHGIDVCNIPAYKQCGTDGFCTHPECGIASGALCASQPPRSVDTKHRLQLARHATYRTGRKDFGHRWTWQYR